MFPPTTSQTEHVRSKNETAELDRIVVEYPPVRVSPALRKLIRLSRHRAQRWPSS